jgi:hypothetical protein
MPMTLDAMMLVAIHPTILSLRPAGEATLQ